MLYREIIAVCSQIHTKHINIMRRLNVEMLNVKPGGTYSYHWALKCLDVQSMKQTVNNTDNVTRNKLLSIHNVNLKAWGYTTCSHYTQ